MTSKNTMYSKCNVGNMRINVKRSYINHYRNMCWYRSSKCYHDYDHAEFVHVNMFKYYTDLFSLMKCTVTRYDHAIKIAGKLNKDRANKLINTQCSIEFVLCCTMYYT